MTERAVVVSGLAKVWIIDLDGVVFRHNSYLVGEDELLEGAGRFWDQIAPDDVVVVMTGRPEAQRSRTLRALADQGLRVDRALFGLPLGERVIINDDKPSGMRTAHAVNLPRDEGLGGIQIVIDGEI